MSESEPCQSCGQMPERLKSDNNRVRCSSENCFLRSMMGWVSLNLWNETMVNLAKPKKAVRSMNAQRVSEIESALLEAIPNEVYQPDLEAVICQQCSGATDDHKANCFVPLVYELLNDVKRHMTSKERK